MATKAEIAVAIRSTLDESGFRKLDANVRSATKNLQGFLAKGVGLGVGVFGAESVFTLLNQEIRHVIRNIAEIPGVPRETIDSITHARAGFADMRQTIDGWIASMASAFTQVSQGLGYMTGAAVYGWDNAVDAYGAAEVAAKEAARAAEDAARRQAQLADDAKRAAEAMKQAEATAKALQAAVAAWASEGVVGESAGARISRLRAEAERLEGSANGMPLDQQLVLREQASRKRAQAAEAELRLNQRAAELGEKQRQAEFERLTAGEQLLELRRELISLAEQAVGLDIADPVQFEQAIGLEERRLEIVREIATIERTITDARIRAAQDLATARASELAARRAQVGGDFRLTYAEKFAENRRILAEEIAAQQQLVDTLRQQRESSVAAGDTTAAAVFDQSILGAEGKLTSLRGQEAGLGPDPMSIRDQTYAALSDIQSRLGTFAESIGRGISTAIGSAVGSVTDGIYSWVSGAKSAGDAFRGLAATMAQTVLHTLIQIGVQEAVLWAARKFRRTQESVQNKQEAGEQATVAGFKSIAQLGPIWGPLAFAGAIAAILALTQAFDSGGLVRGGEQMIRVNERGPEFVLNADAVRSIGLQNLETMNSTGKLPTIGGGAGGFAAGVVLPAAPKVELSPRFIMVDSRAEAKRIARGSEAEDHIIEIVRRRRSEV